MRQDAMRSNFARINFPGLNSFKSYLFLFLVALLSCDTQNGVDREAVKKEMANRELKRLRNSDIVRRGEEIGKKYFDIADA